MICNFVHFYLQHMLHKNTDWFGWSMKFTLHVNFCSEGTSCKPSKITTICCEFVNNKITDITSVIIKSGGTKAFRLLAAKVGHYFFLYSCIVYDNGKHTTKQYRCIAPQYRCYNIFMCLTRLTAKSCFHYWYRECCPFRDSNYTHQRRLWLKETAP